MVLWEAEEDRIRMQERYPHQSFTVSLFSRRSTTVQMEICTNAYGLVSRVAGKFVFDSRVESPTCHFLLEGVPVRSLVSFKLHILVQLLLFYHGAVNSDDSSDV